MSDMGMTLLWAVLLVTFVVIEAVTVQLVSIWFAVGALGGLIAKLCGANVMVQLVAFVAVSLLALLVTKPLVKRFAHAPNIATNMDANIGATAIVVSKIDNQNATGEANLGGLTWLARSMNDAVIEQGEHVTVVRIEGAKLIVEAQK